jgi:hypothetical protein
MGKTTEMIRLLGACSGGRIFFDTLSKHEHLFPGYRMFSEPGPLVSYLRVNRGRRVQILYQPRGGSLDVHFRAVCRIVRAFGWLILAIDEFDALCGPRFGDSRMPDEMYYLVNYGRHVRVSILATARYPMSVARGYTSQCASFRLFRTTERKHVAYFEEFIGSDARRLPSLPKYNYLLWDGGEQARVFSSGRAVA